ncbi:MAG: inositol monophosphatase [Deltaproteobacteria bacterium]|nr:inositol monophosphatase [Deltaproteobacteria bacterium]
MAANDPIEVAVKVAKEAGELLRQGLSKTREIEYKGEVDLVTDMDRRAEELICGALMKAFPTHGIISEEGHNEKITNKTKWIVDPLDGTTNYAHGFPFFCVSIALEFEGELEVGVVYDPMRDELFTAERGKGAKLNGVSISVSSTDELTRSLLATGFPYDIRTSAENNITNFSNFAVRAQAIRRAGAAALDLCYLASSRFDGFWELKLKPWDLAAGVLILKEAGGRVSDLAGNEFSIYDGDVLASNGAIHGQMMEVLKKGRES